MIDRNPSNDSFRSAVLSLLFVPLLMLLADLVIRFSYLKVLEPSLFIHFILSIIFDILFYFFLVWLVSKMPVMKLFALGLVVFAISITQMIAYGHFFYFGVLPNPYSINYFINHRADSTSLISSSIRWIHLFVFLGIFTAQFYLLRNALRSLNVLSNKVKYFFVGAFLVVAVIFNNNVRFAPASYSITPATVFSLKYILQERLFNSTIEVHKGYVRRRFEIKERQPIVAAKYNVIVFISESARKKNFSSYGYERKTTPFLDSLIASGSVIQFSRHVSNAVSTQYSVPMILSGKFTIEKKDQPFVYDYIRRWTNAKTMFFTSQSMLRSNIDLIYNTSLDSFLCQEHVPHEQFNDLGIDDAEFMRSVTRTLANTDVGKYFSIVQFNNTHYPYTVKPGNTEYFTVERPSAIDLYDNTIREQDEIMRSYILSLKTSGRLDSTIIIFTSDHGEAFGEHGHSGHLHSLYNEEIEVPMMMFLPRSFPADLRTMVRENASKNTSHLDIFPTLMEIFELHEVNSKVNNFSGRSLFQPIEEDRIIPIVGKDMIDTKSIISGPMKYIETVSDGKTLNEAYSFISDNNEKKNLWLTLPESSKSEIRLLLRSVDSVSASSKY